MGTMDNMKSLTKKGSRDLTNNDKLKKEGKADQAAGKVNDGINTVSDKAKYTDNVVHDKT